MAMFVRAYLRASTEEQDPQRARAELQRFSTERGVTIAAYYIEQESGASLKRPELFRLLGECEQGDVLLVEQVDRLSRLNGEDWDQLKTEIKTHRVRVVALDLPTSWQMLTQERGQDLTSRIFEAINDMLLDMLAAVARKDYEDRRRRTQQGIEKAKAKGLYRGRPEDAARNRAIIDLLKSGKTWSSIMAASGCSRSTLSRLSKRLTASA
jgi:DNA invertase Pin-like site-specific DNA recombinase